MAHPKTEQIQKLVDLSFDTENGKAYNQLAIYKIHVDALREQDMNARVMTPEKFNLLTSNIKGDRRLETLPFVVKTKSPADEDQFQIISGHHRIRSARAAGITEVIVLVDESDMTESEIKSKQLAHNAISGYDDVNMLKAIYDDIDDQIQKIKSGLTEQDLKISDVNVKIDDLEIDLGFENIHILFLPKQFEKWNEVTGMLEENSQVNIADLETFDKFKKTLIDISKNENVRNISAIMSKMLDIIQEHYATRTDTSEEPE